MNHLHHVHLFSRDLNAAIDWYERALGAAVFFDGDKLRHRITPLRAGEKRVALTFEYVTDPRMSRGRRLISQMKDAVAYFGFRQVFGTGARRAQRRTIEADRLLP